MRSSLEPLLHKYRSLIRDADRVIAPLLETIRIEDLAKHNAGYRRYDADRQKYFVECEKGRFLKALDWIERGGHGPTVCDLGCFIPYLPVVLALLDYRVKIVDKFGLYGEAFKTAILRIAESHRIEVFDLDLVVDDLTPLDASDLVLLMAVVEHLNGTPRSLMETVRRRLAPGGALLFEVPNVAALAKRFRLLWGRSPLPDYAAYFESSYPFLGHNREMTISEVRYLLGQTGFRIERIECYDYWLQPSRTIRGRLLQFVTRFAPIEGKYESILALARPQEVQLPHGTTGGTSIGAIAAPDGHVCLEAPLARREGRSA